MIDYEFIGAAINAIIDGATVFITEDRLTGQATNVTIDRHTGGYLERHEYSDKTTADPNEGDVLDAILMGMECIELNYHASNHLSIYNLREEY